MMTNYNFIIKKFTENDTFTFSAGLIIVIIYLLPLFLSPLYISIFDILDSTIPLQKILAHSGKIFADNNAIIPNMMNGLPRSTYGSEFNIMLWLYYFFEPKTAYIINQITIHIVAYISMWVFLKNYIISKNDKYSSILLLAGSLYFALLPIFSSEGLTIPLLPLVTYSLLNIKNGSYSKWDWILLLLLPLYTDFIFLYVFYIPMAGLYLIWDAIINHKINIRFLLALFLMGIVFLLKDYRLVYDMFLDTGFISHRVEFHKFFVNDLLESLRRGHSFFLNGHSQHLVDLQMPYLIPMILIAIFLSLSKRKFSAYESMTIWLIILISYILNIWPTMLAGIYTLPILISYTLIIWLLSEYNRKLPLLFLMQLVLALITLYAFCECGYFLTETFPFLKMFNISRLTFIQPFLWAILLVYALRVYIERLHYSIWFIILFIIVQTFYQFSIKEFYNTKKLNYATFDQYYAPKLFSEIKHILPKHSIKNRVVSFGFEPAIALYNGFYTVDGYTTNYPLKYKKQFRKVIKKYLDTITEHNNYDEWGSKVYLLGVISLPDYYQKDIVLERLPFSVKALCSLNAHYLLSAYKINDKLQKNLSLIKAFKGDEDSWDIYLYEIRCNNKREGRVNN